MTICPHCLKREEVVCLADPIGCKEGAAARINLPQVVKMNEALFIIVLETNPQLIQNFPSVKPVRLTELGYQIVDRHQKGACTKNDQPPCPLCYLRAVMQDEVGETNNANSDMEK